MLKQYLLSPTCLKCGSFFCDESLFCTVCFSAEITPRVSFSSQTHLVNFQHYYLLEWVKNESDIISQMVYRLKSDNSKPAWVFYTKLFYKILKGKIDFKKYGALVPIPGSKQSSVHSKIFAQELSALTGLPVLDILIKKTQSAEQKTLTAEQRKHQVQIELKTPLIEHITKFIFVDDILTTGSSFLQCNQALHGGGGSVILSLFYRSRATSSSTGA